VNKAINIFLKNKPWGDGPHGPIFQPKLLMWVSALVFALNIRLIDRMLVLFGASARLEHATTRL